MLHTLAAPCRTRPWTSWRVAGSICGKGPCVSYRARHGIGCGPPPQEVISRVGCMALGGGGSASNKDSLGSLGRRWEEMDLCALGQELRMSRRLQEKLRQVAVSRSPPCVLTSMGARPRLQRPAGRGPFPSMPPLTLHACWLKTDLVCCPELRPVDRRIRGPRTRMQVSDSEWGRHPSPAAAPRQCSQWFQGLSFPEERKPQT